MKGSGLLGAPGDRMARTERMSKSEQDTPLRMSSPCMSHEERRSVLLVIDRKVLRYLNRPRVLCDATSGSVYACRLSWRLQKCLA